eukprot:scaffold17824_cov94-Skeletonema_dohrnii-CCMP3373.AAC.2
MHAQCSGSQPSRQRQGIDLPSLASFASTFCRCTLIRFDGCIVPNTSFKATTSSRILPVASRAHVRIATRGICRLVQGNVAQKVRQVEGQRLTKERPNLLYRITLSHAAAYKACAL